MGRLSVQPQWRLIPPLQAPGKVQMAVDTWLLEQHRQGLAPSILRFYTWSPPAISLGYHQRHWPSTWNQLSWKGQPVEVVRRPTGGRAVVHQGDLTYAVVTSDLTGKRAQAYRSLCEFLIQGWRSLGIELQYGQTQRGYLHSPHCFDTATVADLTADGVKFIGSAQLWRGTAVLQQGSMQLEPNLELLGQVFGTQSLATHQSVVQYSDRIQPLIEALVTAASRCFNAQMRVQPLTDSEWQAVLTHTSDALDNSRR